MTGLERRSSIGGGPTRSVLDGARLRDWSDDRVFAALETEPRFVSLFAS